MKFNMIRVVRWLRYKHQLCFFIEELNGNMQLFSKALKFIKTKEKEIFTNEHSIEIYKT